MPIPVPVELDFGAPAPGGLLAVARGLPDGWQRGISFLDTACLAPVVMGECPTGELKPTQRPESATFRPVSLIEAVTCSTLGGLDVAELSATALDQTMAYALARELLTGLASSRDAAPGSDPNPSLVGTASDLGAAFTTLAAAVACLDQSLGGATSGRPGYVFASLGLLTHMLAADVIWRDGARWRTASGNTVVFSAGFDGRAPGSTEPPAADEPLYLYASAGLWAGTGQRATYSDVDRMVNDANARTEDVALAAFSPCAVFAAASTAATAC